MRSDVFISGGGVAGLTLALLLAQDGLSVVLAEQSRGPLSLYKGELLQPKSLAILDKLGALDDLLQTGRKVHTIHMRELEETAPQEESPVLHSEIRFHYAVLGAPYNYALMVPHEKLKSCLQERALRTGRVKLLRPGKCTGLVQGASGLAEEALVDTPDGPERIQADYFVGAEGRTSPTREQMGAKMSRSGYNHHFLTVSFPSPPSLDDSLILSRGGRFLGLFPLPDGLVRTVLLIKPEEYQTMRSQGLQAFYREYLSLLPELGGYVQQITEWRKIQLMIPFRSHADRYVSGNMAILGDAAHNVHPMAGEGMNMAIQDADVLGSLLVWLKRRTGGSPAGLSWYEKVRRPRARYISRLSHLSALAYAYEAGPWEWMRARVLQTIERSPYLHYKYMLNISGLGLWPDSPADLMRQAGMWPDRSPLSEEERRRSVFSEEDDYPWMDLGEEEAP
ncbi:NAD(P)/FAD-dependent oxidoreductase [Paenibacillus mucilaginosus]|nr:NAD(P)/FAD-dependent oxidoreductase [Paenibacillus caseinilyticus]MCZ8523176.1 NAD(P)/FAD-dependent oxidoreductase [Paenibacillus caseinilyticus]